MKKIMLIVAVIVAVMAAVGWGWNDRFIRLIHQSDTHLSDDPNNWSDSIMGLAKNDANAWGANAYIHTGDISEASLAPLKAGFDTMKLVSSAYYACLGNHDIWESTLGKPNDSFIRDNCTGTNAPHFKTGVVTSGDGSFRMRVFALDIMYWHSCIGAYCPSACDDTAIGVRKGFSACGSQFNCVVGGGQLDSISRILAADETSNGILLLFHIPPGDQFKNGQELADTIGADGRPCIGLTGHIHAATYNYTLYNHDSTNNYTVYRPPPSFETRSWTRLCYALIGNEIKTQFASVKNFTDPEAIYTLNTPFTIMSEAAESTATADPPSYWISTASTDGCNTVNFSAGLGILASVIFSGDSSVVPCTTACDYDINDITLTSTYTGIFYDSGFSVVSALGFSDDAITGKHTYPNSLTCNGAASTVHIGSGASTISSQHTQLFLNGLTSMTLDCDKEVYFKRITVGLNAIVQNSGAAARIRVYSDSLPLVVSAGGTFTNNQQVYFYSLAGGSILTQSTGATLNGNNEYRFYLSGITAMGKFLFRIPAIEHTGTWYFSIYKGGGTAAVSDTAIVDGDIITGNQLAISNQDAGGVLLFDFNDHNSTVGASLIVGASAAGATNICKYGNGVHTMVTFAGGILNGASSVNIDSMEGATFNARDWINGTNHVMDFGTSTVNKNTGTAGKIDHNNKLFYGLDITKTGSVVDSLGVGDTLKCGEDFRVVSGKFKQKKDVMKITRDFSVAGTDSCFFDTSINVERNITIAAGSIPIWNTGALLTLTGSSGQKILLGEGVILSVDSLPGIGGTALAPDTIQGGTLTALQDTLSYTRVVNLTATNGLYLDSSATTGGGNTGVYSLSYTGATLSASTAHAGDTLRVYAGNGLVGGGARIGETAVTSWTVLDQDTARFIVPAGTGTGLSFTVWNSDADTLTVPAAFGYASTGRKSPYGYGYKKYRY